ncbi:TMhelix containing protein [Vibrio phage 1.245.O._10N.261.54.C7]|uniref:TMhelix containing protein n=1 Tax=Vibrio phage 1.245.O._10N.261.54.C7 TaxID=1881236 RepID=A0A2I7RWF9_9CAUD|nr:TMhelix containing protein [Vibrio phage 1.245.O._10N.261.54.C7]AUR97985.1 TMhelix containing protein [Vibrio phage 1.245.O._10N.261.54.C7]
MNVLPIIVLAVSSMILGCAITMFVVSESLEMTSERVNYTTHQECVITEKVNCTKELTWVYVREEGE